VRVRRVAKPAFVRLALQTALGAVDAAGEDVLIAFAGARLDVAAVHADRRSAPRRAARSRALLDPAARGNVLGVVREECVSKIEHPNDALVADLVEDGAVHASCLDEATPAQTSEMVRHRVSLGSWAMAHALLHRLHNPHGRECTCDPDCWCRRTALGRAAKWWFPSRYFGLHHKNAALEQWKRRDPDRAAEWKRDRADDADR
jgi:hypothetical protein